MDEVKQEKLTTDDRVGITLLTLFSIWLGYRAFILDSIGLFGLALIVNLSDIVIFGILKRGNDGTR